MEQEDIVFTSLFLVVLSKVFYDRIYPDMIQMKLDWINFLHALNSWKGYFIMLIIALPLILYLTYRQSIKLYIKKQEKNEYDEEVESYKERIQELLDEDIDDFDLEEIYDHISEIKAKL